MKTSLALLFIVGTLGAQESASPGQTKQLFSITITPFRADVKSGSAVDIKIRLTNTSRHKTLLGTWFRAYGNIDPAYDYICLDEKERIVNRDFPIMGDLGDHAIPVLAPGESQEEVVTVSTACDLHKPGRYTIQVSRKYPKDAKHRVVKSNFITIAVTE